MGVFVAPDMLVSEMLEEMRKPNCFSYLTVVYFRNCSVSRARVTSGELSSILQRESVNDNR